MSDYTKMRNAELEALLKARGLPHSGKKADLVARLQEDDSKKAEEGTTSAQTGPASTTTVTANEDEIDWDDDAAEPPKPTAPAAQPSATVSETAPSNAGVTSTSAAVKDGNNASGNSENVKPSEGEKDDAKPAVDFSVGLAATSIEEEIEKRKARAKKFGISEEDPLAAEALKTLERAKKFGESGGPRGLNEALPERREKRRRDGRDEGARDSKRRGGRPAGGRGDRRRQPNEGGTRSNGAPSWMSDRDRAAAEARRNRFDNR